MKEIPLTRGFVASVDDEDYEEVSALKWSAAGSPPHVYARRNDCSGGYNAMHRMIAKAKPGEWVDHRNGDTLDNTRANLRICNRQQNRWNSRAEHQNKSGFKGVHYFAPTRRWQAHIRTNGKKRHLGYFATAEEAARAYDEAAKEIHGEFARPNLPATATPK